MHNVENDARKEFSGKPLWIQDWAFDLRMLVVCNVICLQIAANVLTFGWTDSKWHYQGHNTQGSSKGPKAKVKNLYADDVTDVLEYLNK